MTRRKAAEDVVIFAHGAEPYAGSEYERLDTPSQAPALDVERLRAALDEDEWNTVVATLFTESFDDIANRLRAALEGCDR